MLIHGQDVPDSLRAALGYRSAVDVLFDPRGFTVRCTPLRRVLAMDLDGYRVFRKIYQRGARAALAEWNAMHQLRALGLNTARPLCVAATDGLGALVTEAVAGRPIAVWLREACGNRDQLAQWVGFLCREVAPLVARLHGAGLVYRDLYWNHIYANGCGPGDQVSFIDTERLFRPRWRRERWVVKDLAGLRASLPDGVRLSARQELRFLDACGISRSLARPIVAKADRIRLHAPKYG